MKATHVISAALWIGGILSAAAGGRAESAEPTPRTESVFTASPAPLQVLTEIQAVVAPGLELMVEQVQGEWVWVRVQGWVHRKYVQGVWGVGRPEPGHTLITQMETPLQVLSEIRAVVPPGRKLTVELVEGEWIWATVQGWCQARYLSREPVAPPPPAVDYSWDQEREPSVYYYYSPQYYYYYSTPYRYSWPYPSYRPYYRPRTYVWSDVDIHFHGWPGRPIQVDPPHRPLPPREPHDRDTGPSRPWPKPHEPPGRPRDFQPKDREHFRVPEGFRPQEKKAPEAPQIRSPEPGRMQPKPPAPSGGSSGSPPPSRTQRSGPPEKTSHAQQSPGFRKNK